MARVITVIGGFIHESKLVVFLLLCIVLLNTYDHYKVIVSVRLVSSVTRGNNPKELFQIIEIKLFVLISYERT